MDTQTGRVFLGVSRDFQVELQVAPASLVHMRGNSIPSMNPVDGKWPAGLYAAPIMEFGPATPDPVLTGLEDAEAKLAAEVARLPQVVMLEDTRRLIAQRRELLKATSPGGQRGSQSSKQGGIARSGSKGAIVLDYAEAYLSAKGARAQSKEMLNELQRQGISFEGKDPVAAVASYLSTARDRFDNVLGQGYGLVSWGGVPPNSPQAVLGQERSLERSAEKVTG